MGWNDEGPSNRNKASFVERQGCFGTAILEPVGTASVRNTVPCLDR
jgi:hypothetical protein